MKRLTFSFTVLLLLLVAAPHSAQAQKAKHWVGTWVDQDGGARMTLSLDGKRLQADSYVDYDGEAFEIKSFEKGKKKHYVITYFVPSTGYTVSLDLHMKSKSALAYSWSNSMGESSPDGEYSEFLKD